MEVGERRLHVMRWEREREAAARHVMEVGERRLHGKHEPDELATVGQRHQVCGQTLTVSNVCERRSRRSARDAQDEARPYHSTGPNKTLTKRKMQASMYQPSLVTVTANGSGHLLSAKGLRAKLF